MGRFGDLARKQKMCALSDTFSVELLNMMDPADIRNFASSFQEDGPASLGQLCTSFSYRFNDSLPERNRLRGVSAHILSRHNRSWSCVRSNLLLPLGRSAVTSRKIESVIGSYFSDDCSGSDEEAGN